MASNPEKSVFTPEEYLELERNSAERHEYYRGEIFAMSGGSLKHNTITLNISGELREKFKSTQCNVFAMDMKVKVSATGLYTYPDVAAACGDLEFETDGTDLLLNPHVIFEVLSKSTEQYDRGEKFLQYRTIPSFTDYLLVDQFKTLVEHHTRLDNDTWKTRFYQSPDDTIAIDSLGIVLPVEEIYRKVTFEEGSDELQGPGPLPNGDNEVHERRPGYQMN